MVTNNLRQIAPRQGVTAEAEARRAEDGLAATMFDRVRQMFCGLHGHDSLLQFKQDRMFLKCFSCGHESPGWELNEPPPTVVAAADHRRLALVRPQLDVSLRHTA